jgi:hypothetical protein
VRIITSNEEGGELELITEINLSERIATDNRFAEDVFIV